MTDTTKMKRHSTMTSLNVSVGLLRFTPAMMRVLFFGVVASMFVVFCSTIVVPMPCVSRRAMTVIHHIHVVVFNLHDNIRL